jgi:hypothetical protein
MQLQLKHLPFLFVAVAALCLTGALTASANASDDKLPEAAAQP